MKKLEINTNVLHFLVISMLNAHILYLFSFKKYSSVHFPVMSHYTLISMITYIGKFTVSSG
jgi:hypothetical protein